MNRKSFGELELRVLQVFEGLDCACVEDIQKRLGGSLAYTTVQTIVTRLFDKGLLTREKRGRRYYYRLHKRKARSKITELLSRQFLKPTQVLSYFLEDPHTISEAELKEMEQLILEARKKR